MRIFMEKCEKFYFVFFLLLNFVLMHNDYAIGFDNTNGGITNAGAISGVTSLSATGISTGTLGVNAATTLTGVTDINVGGTETTTIGNQSSAVNILGGTNTIGNAGSSVNTLAGSDNTLNATAQNEIAGGTGNAITAVTGNNVISALGVDGENHLMANPTTGTNAIEAKNNNLNP